MDVRSFFKVLIKRISVKECFRLFKITSSAFEVLEQAIKNERNTEDEKLYVRLTMGIG